MVPFYVWYECKSILDPYFLNPLYLYPIQSSIARGSPCIAQRAIGDMPRCRNNCGGQSLPARISLVAPAAEVGMGDVTRTLLGIYSYHNQNGNASKPWDLKIPKFMDDMLIGLMVNNQWKTNSSVKMGKPSLKIMDLLSTIATMWWTRMKTMKTATSQTPFEGSYWGVSYWEPLGAR